MWLCVFLFCDRYNINTMYAMAASIPKNPDQLSYDLTKVMPDPQTKWKDGILKTSKLVVATKKDVTPRKGNPYTEHAEWRVLQNLPLFQISGNLLVFFSYASPCYERCANPDSKLRITNELSSLFSQSGWGAKAFVFDTLFRPHGEDINSNRIDKALTNIRAAIGRHNIFRCYRPDNVNFRCIKCFRTDPIDPNCIS